MPLELTPADYIDLLDAAKQFPGDPDTSAIWRWCRKGCKARSGERVHLKHVRVGGKLFTTKQWCAEFLSALASADARHFQRPGTEGGESRGLISQCGSTVPAPAAPRKQRTPQQRAAAIRQARMEVETWNSKK